MNESLYLSIMGLIILIGVIFVYPISEIKDDIHKHSIEFNLMLTLALIFFGIIVVVRIFLKIFGSKSIVG